MLSSGLKKMNKQRYEELADEIESTLITLSPVPDWDVFRPFGMPYEEFLTITDYLNIIYIKCSIGIRTRSTYDTVVTKQAFIVRDIIDVGVKLYVSTAIIPQITYDMIRTVFRELADGKRSRP